MNRWMCFLMFPYVVSVIPKEGSCVRWNDFNMTECAEREAGAEVYYVAGIEIKDKDLALDVAKALNKAHESRETSSVKDLPLSDEPSINDDTTAPTYYDGKKP